MKKESALSTPPPSPTPTEKWTARFKATQEAWPTVEQIAHLAASLAQAYPKAKPDALADKALSLWRAGQAAMVRHSEEMADEEEQCAMNEFNCYQSPLPKFPLAFDKALRLIVGKIPRLPKRHKKFRDYLSECFPNRENLFAILKKDGFNEEGYLYCLEKFPRWREKSDKAMREARAKKAAAALHHPPDQKKGA